MAVERTFLSWREPLIGAAVKRLAAGWEGAGPLDLRSLLLVVSTRQAGRRLRAALAAHASARGQGVLPPRVVLPEEVLDLARPAAVVPASRARLLLAWVAACRDLPIENLRAVFPVDPPRRDFSWALGLAESFVRLQEELAEGGLRLADVSARLPEDFPEKPRWEQLAALEDRCDRLLAAAGFSPPGASARAAAETPQSVPSGVTRVAVLAAVDLRRGVEALLRRWSEALPVEVLVFAEPEDGERFDAWGRPLPDSWAEAVLNIPDFEARVHVVADGSEQADALARGLAGYESQPGVAAVGCANREDVPALAAALAAEGVVPFRPEGQAWAELPLAGLLRALLAAGADDRWGSIRPLMQRAEVLEMLARLRGVAPAEFLAELDAIQRRHLPGTVRDVIERAGAGGTGGALAEVCSLVADFRGRSFPGTCQEVLARIFSGRRFDPADAGDRAFLDSAEKWREAADEVAEARQGMENVGVADAIELSLRLFESQRRYEDKPAEAVEIDGWLELLFRDEPHLLLAGCNEGALPESVVGHAFLPESLRERLGLRTNAHRLARDVWQLAALIECRRARGRVDLWTAHFSRTGDPLRPSRLLLKGADAGLPGRVARLFGGTPAPSPRPPWRRAWQLQVPAPEEYRSMRVTAFRDYLACPFRFHLKHGLRLEAVPADVQEMDPFAYGTLLHGVLEGLRTDPAWRDCTDGVWLAEAFGRRLDDLVKDQFGRRLSVPLLVQVESARRRLGHAAHLQAAERAAGWVVCETEWKFPDALELSGLRITGRIDRIERHEQTGAWRVLDYKTSEQALSPAKAHLKPRRGAADSPARLPEALVSDGGRMREWIDLQLPLYRWAVRGGLGAAGAQIGYFNLPKAVTETAVEVWDGFDDGTEAQALACAGAVAKAVRERRFWPPEEDPRTDDFDTLFQHGVAESVAWIAAGGAAR